MSKELFWLALTVAMTTLLAFPCVLNRISVRGLMEAMKNPSSDDKPVPAVHVVNRGDLLAAAACGLYFFSRVLHYVIYTAGIPVVRTLAFFGGWAGIAIHVARQPGVL